MDMFMNEKGNQYAIAALKNCRATMAGEIARFKQGIWDREEQLTHLDTTLRVLNPSYWADTIAPKRIKQFKLFGQGKLNRLIFDALRRADGKPLSTPEIADAIIAAKGLWRRRQARVYPHPKTTFSPSTSRSVSTAVVTALPVVPIITVFAMVIVSVVMTIMRVWVVAAVAGLVTLVTITPREHNIAIERDVSFDWCDGSGDRRYISTAESNHCGCNRYCCSFHVGLHELCLPPS
jgi:hypothetical protein